MADPHDHFGRSCSPDETGFAVTAVSKNVLAGVSLHWLEKGLTVLQETPATVDLPMLEKLWLASREGQKLVIAEQYTRYPVYSVLLKILQSGLIGERDLVYLSAAHEYHGVSLMRAFLDVPFDMPFSVSAQSFTTPAVRTMTRYDRFTDGQEIQTTRNTAVFRWADGKAALYDFDSEQYRSPIRNNMIRIQGRRGEICNDTVTWLDQNNEPVQARLETASRLIHTGENNPNFSVYPEITGIRLKDRIVYDPPFGAAGLSEDETAVALMMKQTGKYARGESSGPYPLQDALTDAYAAILLRQALSGGGYAESRPQIWQRP